MNYTRLFKYEKATAICLSVLSRKQKLQGHSSFEGHLRPKDIRNLVTESKEANRTGLPERAVPYSSVCFIRWDSAYDSI